MPWYTSHYTTARVKAIIKLSSGCSCKMKSTKSKQYFFIVFDETIIPLALWDMQRALVE